MACDGDAAVGGLMLLEFLTFGFALSLGWLLLEGITSSCPGFRFMGITLILLALSFLVLLCIACAICYRPSCTIASPILLCCSVLVNLAVAALGIFALAVSNKGGGEPIPGRVYEEYHVESYSNWMRNKVNDTHSWETYYKKAIVKHNVCKKFGKEYKLDTPDEFHIRKLSPFESSCCKPPENCNFNYTSSTIWVKPENANYTNNDCNRWDNDPNILCFDCQSCKAAFLQDLKSHWSLTGKLLVALAAKQFLIGVCYLFSLCCGGGHGD